MNTILLLVFSLPEPQWYITRTRHWGQLVYATIYWCFQLFYSTTTRFGSSTIFRWYNIQIELTAYLYYRFVFLQGSSVTYGKYML
jgi:hypothetical protein